MGLGFGPGGGGLRAGGALLLHFLFKHKPGGEVCIWICSEGLGWVGLDPGGGFWGWLPTDIY